ncbi:MAG: mandelate racemase/muconate lactonizing enzyme family protein, partial [Solirubrobacteraceae bacterium]
GPYLEFPYDPPGWTPQRRDFMLARPLEIDAGGWLVLPAAPGLGIELDEEAVAFHAVEAIA